MVQEVDWLAIDWRIGGSMLDTQRALQPLLLLTALFELIKLYSAEIKQIMAGTVINGTTAGKSPATF